MKLIGALLARQPRRYALPGAQIGLVALNESLSSSGTDPFSPYRRWLDAPVASLRNIGRSTNGFWPFPISWNMVEARRRRS